MSWIRALLYPWFVAIEFSNWATHYKTSIKKNDPYSSNLLWMCKMMSFTHAIGAIAMFYLIMSSILLFPDEHAPALFLVASAIWVMTVAFIWALRLLILAFDGIESLGSQFIGKLESLW